MNISKYIQFVLLNLVAVNGYYSLIMLNDDDAGFKLTGLLISIPIIIVQYPLLQQKSSWGYKILIFYLSMFTFLFVLGVFLSWNSKVGSSPSGSWLARIDGGMRTVFFGHIMGGLIGMVPIVLINFILRKRLF